MPSLLIPLDKARADAAQRARSAKAAAVTPQLLGLPLFQARWFANLAELSVSVTRAAASGPAGHVVAQYPSAGEPSFRDGLVHIVVIDVERRLTDGRDG